MKALLSAEVAPSAQSFRDILSGCRREIRLRGRLNSRLRRLASLASYSELEGIEPASARDAENMRRRPRQGEFAVQLGGSGEGSILPSDLLTVSGAELAGYASVLSLILRGVGLRKGSKLAILDYSTSLPALSASRLCNGLGVDGVSEQLGVSSICCDGLPEFVPRSAYVIRKVKPGCVLVRSDLLHILRTTLKTTWKGAPPLRLLVTYDERDSPPLSPGFPGATVLAMPRVDNALFACLVEDGTLLYDSSRFLVEVVADSGGKRVSDGEAGHLCVTRLFSPESSSVRYVTNLEVELRRNRAMVPT